jgi:hypothetical protein
MLGKARDAASQARADQSRKTLKLLVVEGVSGNIT